MENISGSKHVKAMAPLFFASLFQIIHSAGLDHHGDDRRALECIPDNVNMMWSRDVHNFSLNFTLKYDTRGFIFQYISNFIHDAGRQTVFCLITKYPIFL